MELRNRLDEWGVEFSSGSDSEVVAHLLAWAPGETWAERISYLIRSLEGASSLTIATKDTLIGIRDPMGIRPLCIGRYGAGWIIASESCALDQVGAQFLREIEPGSGYELKITESQLLEQEGLPIPADLTIDLNSIGISSGIGSMSLCHRMMRLMNLSFPTT